MGEGESGIIENNWPPAFEQDPGLPGYPVVMLQAMLDGWGTIEQDYFAARGNHDRSMAGSGYDTCTAVPNTSPQHYDCWGDVFPYSLQQLQAYEVGGLRLIGLDTTMLDAAGGTMSSAQLGQLADILHHDKERPTLLFGHHPVTYESAATTEAGPAFDIDRPTAIALQQMYSRAPRVRLLAAAPVHRRLHDELPHYMLGTIADRNHTVTRDLSGLRPLR